MAKGQEKLDWIMARLAEGLTVYICSHTRATKITSKMVARWTQAGTPLLKVDLAGHLCMMEGKHYVSAEYCSLRAS